MFSLAAAVVIGMVGKVFLSQPLGDTASETVYITMVTNIFPTFIAGILLSAIVALFMALDPNSTVLGLVEYAWGGFGATFGPVILLSLFWKGATRNGALFGIIAGGITTIIWKQLSGGIFDLYEIVPGFILSFIVIVAVSLMDNPPSKEMLDEFEEVNRLDKAE